MVELSHDFLKKSLHSQAICIDGTVGNGKDSQFLLDAGVKKVYGFEIQKEVLENAKRKISDSRFVAILDGHEKLDAYIFEEVDAIVFNFGFCPFGDETITTLPKTSVQAVQKGLEKLKIKGRMALVLYPHQYGNTEQNEIEKLLKTLPAHSFQIEKIQSLNVENMPYLICIERRS